MSLFRSALAGLACLLSVSAAAAETLYFSAIPDEDATALTARFTKVADYLSGQLGVDVVFVPVKSYPAAVTAFTNDQVQLAWFGGLTSVQARLANPGAKSLRSLMYRVLGVDGGRALPCQGVGAFDEGVQRVVERVDP